MSVRFGLRLRFPFGLIPNAGVFVGLMSVDGYEKVKDAVDVLRAALVFAGRPDWAELLVFERR
jgi:hypothetical protein